MAPVRTKKRGSDASTASKQATRKTKLHSSSPATPNHRSPIKQRKMNITLQQKQALIDNLQLEVTERARRLRAQYHLQAQGLRSRIEIRINRIPMSLRKIRMEDLLQKYAEQSQKKATAAMRPPPVPAKDIHPVNNQKPSQGSGTSQRPGRPQKRTSDAISADKENSMEPGEGPKKRVRGAQPHESAAVRSAQILSPTSSNARLMNRDRSMSPAKSQIARPASPLKTGGTTRTAAATSMLSSFVEKAKSSRAVGGRKVTTTSNTSSSSAGNAAPAAKTRRGAATAASRAPASRPATRTGRRVSAHSETSDGSTSTVVRKPVPTRATAQTTRKKATEATGKAAETKRGAAARTAAPTTTRTGRILRNRG